MYVFIFVGDCRMWIIPGKEEGHVLVLERPLGIVVLDEPVLGGVCGGLGTEVFDCVVGRG